MNRTLHVIACCIALAVALSANAQQVAPNSPGAAGTIDAAALASLRARIRTDRKALVAQNLPLTETEASAFWPAYDECHKSIDSADRKANRAIVEYVGSESRMTDAHALQITKEVLAAEADETRARKACFDRVAKILPGKKAARYLQIETKIDALSRFDAAVAIPLMY